MWTRNDPGPALIRLAAHQAGVVSREQAVAHGQSRRSIERLLVSGQWHRLCRGTYLVHPTAEAPSWLSLAWCGVLLGGDRAQLAGEAAGHLHEIIANRPDQIDVLVPHGRPRRDRDRWHFIQARDGIRWNSRDEPPRTDLDDTVLDLTDSTDPSRVVDLVTRAVQTRRTTTDRLRLRLESRHRHAQRALLTELLGDVRAGAQSPLELRYLSDVERRHSLPRGERQHRARGTLQDVWYRQFATVVELDGKTGHEGAGRHRDMQRDNRSTVTGAATLRYGWWDVVNEPCRVAAQVATVLGSRGWSGPLVPCPRCALAHRSDGLLHRHR